MSDNNPQPYSVISNILRSIIDGTEYDGPADSRIAQLLLELKATIEGFPKPMVYKGTLGTGGTITTLPAASSENIGDTYVVITAGTYASQSANIGDIFISTGTDWTYVPSGDIDIIDDSTTSSTKVWSSNKTNTELGKKENAHTTITETLTAGQTTVTFTDASILANSLISVYAPVWYVSQVSSVGSVVITFPEQASDMAVTIEVK